MPMCALPIMGFLTSRRSIGPTSSSTWNSLRRSSRSNADWIAGDRTGLAICDATSAAFSRNIDWRKIDVGTFSRQKRLSGEGGHGMIVLSARWSDSRAARPDHSRKSSA